MGMAMRGDRRDDTLAGPFDRRECFRLAVVADFHRQREHENDAARNRRHGQSDASIRERHIGINVPRGRYGYRSHNAEKQADRKREKSADKCHDQDARRNRIPAWRACSGFPRHLSNLHQIFGR